MSIQEELEQIVSDEAINNAWGYADFGKVERREIIRNTLLKFACGYHAGHTAKMIVIDLGLATGELDLTILGRQYLYLAYCQNWNL